jgi:diacylglycerol O-acyltransferase / wax synthase
MRDVERLAPADLAVLWPEDFGWPQDVGLLLILGATRGLDVERLRCHVGDRLGLLPSRFRKVLVRPRPGLGRPYWTDATHLDLDYHVRAEALPAGAGESQLLEACERVRRLRFDAARPRWHLTLLQSHPGGQSAVMMSVHHCLVDGVTGVLALGALIDIDGPLTVPAPPPPGPAPTTADLLADVVRGSLRHLKAADVLWRRPGGAWRQLIRDGRVVRRMNRPTPATSLNGRLGPRRRYALVRTSLGTCTAIAHNHGATVNDVLLCVLAGGLRALLVSRGESPDGLLLRAAVPVAQHAGDGPAEGNSDGGVLLALPVGQADPVMRLRQVARDSAEHKRHWVLRGAASPLFRAGFVQRLVLHLTPGQRLCSSYVANVHGPPLPLSLAGAPILEAFPIVPLLGNLTIGLGALSYAGQLAITVVAGGDGCRDLSVVVEAMERDLEALGSARA